MWAIVCYWIIICKLHSHRNTYWNCKNVCIAFACAAMVCTYTHIKIHLMLPHQQYQYYIIHFHFDYWIVLLLCVTTGLWLLIWRSLIRVCTCIFCMTYNVCLLYVFVCSPLMASVPLFSVHIYVNCYCQSRFSAIKTVCCVLETSSDQQS